MRRRLVMSGIMRASQAWRKRMGVEPTKDRLAAPPGFEVRTPHRGRFSSLIRCRRRLYVGGGTKRVEPMLVHAAEIAATQRHAVTIEEFKNLDRDLAAVVDLIAELRGGELAAVRRGGQAPGDPHHLRHGAPQEEMVAGDLI